MSGKVTVVVFAHEYPELLSESLESVLEQTYPDLEIVVAAPASTGDRLNNPLGQYKDRLIYCETDSVDHGGMMNAALQTSTGDFVTSLNAGDVLLPNKIRLQVEEFGKNPDVGLVLTGCLVVDEDNNIRNIVNVPGSSQKPLLFFLLYGYTFDGGKVMVRRECYDRVGPYKEGLAAEHDVWIRLAEHYEIGVVNSPLLKQKFHPIDKEVNERLRQDTRQVIFQAVDSVALEDIFPRLRSCPDDPSIRSSAYAAIGAILMAYELFPNARDSFARAHQLCPDTALNLMWLGILSRRAGKYEAALKFFAGVPEGDRFYLDARWAATLTRQVQKASKGVTSKLRTELINEHNILLQLTLELADGKTHGTTQLLSDVVEEIQPYLGWDISQVLGALFKGRELMKDEWNTRSPQGRDEVVNFYKETENYIFDLAWWHRDFGRKQLTTAAIDICRQNRSRKILDFGCGTGQDGILFAEAGFDVTLGDLPGKTFDYAKWRIEKSGLDIDFVNSDGLTERYDAILCFDVLEHIWEPGEIVKYLYQHLSDGGILLVTTHFGHSEEHPMHLARNDKYMGDNFTEMMSEAGFRMESWSRAPFVFHRSA